MNKKAKHVNFSFLGTDVHSHLLPGLDDGAKNMEESIQMIRMFKELGYKKIITTPHIMSDNYKNTPEIILKALENLQQTLLKHHIDIEVQAAAEYYMDDAFFKMVKEKSLLTFGDNYVLFELPFFTEPVNLKEILFEMQLAGYKPVLAHPERYGYWHHRFEQYQSFHEQGILLQLNLLSLTGHYANEVRKVAEKLLNEEIISLLGTDCHRIEQLYMLNSQLPQLSYEKLQKAKVLNDTL